MSAAVIAAPRKRSRGLALLLLAVLASLLAYALQSLGLSEELPENLVVYGVLFAVVAVAGWAAIRIMAKGADPAVYPTAVMLGGLGLAMLYRLMTEKDDPTVALLQGIWLLIGVACVAITLFLTRDIRRLDAYTYTFGLAGLILLLLPILPVIGAEENGARLWVDLRVVPPFQPAEFGRLLIVIFLASYLSAKRELLAAGVGRFGLPRIKDLGPLMLAWGISLMILFLERDMGASLLLFAVFTVMLWVATGRPVYLMLGLVLFAVGATLGWLAFPHIQDRVDYWLHALDPTKVTGEGYGQIAQGWFAMSSGGLVGAGLGQGSPTFIPYVGSDFILAAFGEELGMLGVSALLLLYLVLIGRGLRIAVERQDPFSKLLATGLVALLGIQVFVIAAGVLRLIPLTGVPLPLVSYGGTSRVATSVALALLIRMSAGPWIRAARSKET